MRTELNRLSRRLIAHPLNPSIRKAFIQCGKQHKKLLKSKEKEHFRKLKTELKNIEQNNPRQFWSIIKSTQKDDNVVYKNPINNQTWEEYLNKLYQNNSQDNGLLNNPSASFNHEEVAIDVIINRKITRSEMKKAIKKLKNGKSAGEDNIINEVLKTAEVCVVEPTVKLMNLILESEKYPLKENCNAKTSWFHMKERSKCWRTICISLESVKSFSSY